MTTPTAPRRPSSARQPVADLRGSLRLLADGTRGVTAIAGALHGQIQRLAPPLRWGTWLDAELPDGSAGLPPARGLSGLVYRSIQGTARLVGDGFDGLLAPFDTALAGTEPSPRRDMLVAALNGVLGDHLLHSDNPLALPLQLRQHGRPLDVAALGPQAPGRLLLLVHGLCMSDHGWCRNGHDHGQALAPALGAAPVYAFYNSGLHISTNGRALSQALQAVVDAWPVALARVDIVGHSMGGLVARSALAQAAAAGHTWPAKLQSLVFLGTPHHGAPLERAGNWLHRVLDLSPYAAPFTRLSGLRSQGITDLRHGNLLDADWRGPGRFDGRDHRSPVALPDGVQAWAIAGTTGGPGQRGSMVSDGLVPVESALGHHRRAAMRLNLPVERCWVGHGIGHLDLLSDPLVYRKLLGWMG
ncbi:MAG TPA: alpha/beta hydrolase [Aquabacterium sp.]|nr:alpha/beta hydrolase [Aquabacterium sp.]